MAHPNLPNRNDTEGNFVVLHKTNLNDVWQRSTGWEMAATEKQDLNSTGKANRSEERRVGKECPV